VIHEALRVPRAGGEQGVVPSHDDLRRAPVLDGGGRHQPDAGVPMLVAVVADESMAEAKGIPVDAEPVGKLRAILEGLEVGLGLGSFMTRLRRDLRLRRPNHPTNRPRTARR